MSIGDDSQKSWQDAPQWQRDSAISGAEYARANPNAKPEDSHENWFREKTLAGWRYGPVKDEAKKEHPCMLLYQHLPEEQRRKDALFLAIVRALSF